MLRHASAATDSPYTSIRTSRGAKGPQRTSLRARKPSQFVGSRHLIWPKATPQSNRRMTGQVLAGPAHLPADIDNIFVCDPGSGLHRQRSSLFATATWLSRFGLGAPFRVVDGDVSRFGSRWSNVSWNCCACGVGYHWRAAPEI